MYLRKKNYLFRAHNLQCVIFDVVNAHTINRPLCCLSIPFLHGSKCFLHHICNFFVCLVYSLPDMGVFVCCFFVIVLNPNIMLSLRFGVQVFVCISVCETNESPNQNRMASSIAKRTYTQFVFVIHVFLRCFWLSAFVFNEIAYDMYLKFFH